MAHADEYALPTQVLFHCSKSVCGMVAHAIVFVCKSCYAMHLWYCCWCYLCTVWLPGSLLPMYCTVFRHDTLRIAGSDRQALSYAYSATFQRELVAGWRGIERHESTGWQPVFVHECRRLGTPSVELYLRSSYWLFLFADPGVNVLAATHWNVMRDWLFLLFSKPMSSTANTRLIASPNKCFRNCLTHEALGQIVRCRDERRFCFLGMLCRAMSTRRPTRQS